MPVGVDDHLLVRERQRHRAPLGGPVLPEPSHLGQQRRDLRPGRGIAVVERPLQGRVVELGPGAHDGTLEHDIVGRPVGVEIELPHQRRSVLTRSQRRGMLAQHRWVQRDPTVGQVDRDAPRPALVVERATDADEGGHVRDGVADPEPLTSTFDVDRLVQVGAARRIDRHEVDPGQVPAPATGCGVTGESTGAGGQVCRREHLGRELPGERELLAQLPQAPSDPLVRTRFVPHRRGDHRACAGQSEGAGHSEGAGQRGGAGRSAVLQRGPRLGQHRSQHRLDQIELVVAGDQRR